MVDSKNSKKSSRPLSHRAKSIRIKNARGRKTSSQRWLRRHLNDPFVQKAQVQGYRSRAAYKLEQIQEKYKIFRPGLKVVDLGAAPGGWTQIALKYVKPQDIIGVDLLEIEPIQDVHFVVGDFHSAEIRQEIQAHLDGKVDVVISDMAAATTGHRKTDHIRTIALADIAYTFAQQVLSENGSFVAKVFAGGTDETILQRLKKDFKEVKHYKPEASRKESPEMYVVAKGFKG